MNSAQPSPDRIMQVATGDWAASILATSLIHSVPTHLHNGAATPDDVAKQAKIAVRGAQTLLDGLVGLGLAEVGEDGYRNAPDADAFLVEGGRVYLGGFSKMMFRQMGRWADLPAVVASGVPASADTTDVPELGFWEELVPAIAPMAVPSVLAAAELLGVAKAGPLSILDVGGGSGIFSALWLAMNPQARSTQIDWGNVNRIATAFVAGHGVGDRFRTIDGDFHTVEFGTAVHDIAVYSHMAHQERPGDNVAIFRKFRQALKPGGTLVINDFVVDNGRGGPPFALIFHTEMLLRTRHGSTWTEDDFRAWLGEAGFADVSVHPTAGPATLVLAT